METLRFDIVKDITDQSGIKEEEYLSVYIKDCDGIKFERLMALLFRENIILDKVTDRLGIEYLLTPTGTIESVDGDILPF